MEWSTHTFKFGRHDVRRVRRPRFHISQASTDQLLALGFRPGACFLNGARFRRSGNVEVVVVVVVSATIAASRSTVDHGRVASTRRRNLLPTPTPRVAFISPPSSFKIREISFREAKQAEISSSESSFRPSNLKWLQPSGRVGRTLLLLLVSGNLVRHVRCAFLGENRSFIDGGHADTARTTHGRLGDSYY